MIIVWAVAVGGYLHQTSFLLYTGSKVSPTNTIHGAALIILIGLLIGGLHRLAPRFSRGMWRGNLLSLAAIFAAVMAFPVILQAAVKSESHNIRLMLYDRTSLTFRALDLLSFADLRDERSVFDEVEGECPTMVEEDLFAIAESSDRPQGVEQVDRVIFILIDALRYDRLGAERDGVALTPNLNRVDERARSFARAYVTSPSTRHSVYDMVEGRWSAISSDQAASAASDEDFRTLGAILGDLQPTTIGVPHHGHVRRVMGEFDTVEDDFAKGIDSNFNVTAHLVTQQAKEALYSLEADDSFLLLAHYFDPHAYYRTNELFDFGRSITARYDAEVAYADHWVGELLEHVEDRFGVDNTAIVITSDHGEEFYEHRYYHHGYHLYDESIRIPLMVDAQGVDAEVVDTPVSGVDIAPTILDLFGEKLPAGMDGQSLLRVDDDEHRYVFSRSDVRSSVIDNNHKLIVNSDTSVVELYELESDPEELRNLADEEVETRNALLCVLAKWHEEFG